MKPNTKAPRVTKKASARMAAAKECVTCWYEGKEYSQGAVICVGKKAYRCHEGEWVGWGRC